MHNRREEGGHTLGVRNEAAESKERLLPHTKYCGVVGCRLKKDVTGFSCDVMTAECTNREVGYLCV